MELSTFVSRKLLHDRREQRSNSFPLYSHTHHRRHSRERGNLFTRAHRAVRWDKYSQRKTSTNAETASPIIVILANAGIHLSACTEQCVGISTHSDKHSKCRESTVNAVVPSTHNARFRMDPRLREDDKQKTKETSKQENVWDGVEYFCLQKTAARQTRTALKFVSIIEPHPPSPSFSRTRESIYPRAPSMALGKVLTVVNIYKRRNSVPHRRHSRERGNPFTRAHRAWRWDKYSQRKTSTNAETASPIIVILANAGIHLSARTEQCVGKSPYSDKHSKCRESTVNAVVPSTRNERFRMDPRLREDDKQKTKETSKQENVWEGVEYFCLQKAAVRQTRTAFKFVSIIEPHPPSPSFSRTRESIYPRAPSMALGKVLTAANIPNAERAQ